MKKIFLIFFYIYLVGNTFSQEVDSLSSQQPAKIGYSESSLNKLKAMQGVLKNQGVHSSSAGSVEVPKKSVFQQSMQVGLALFGIIVLIVVSIRALKKVQSSRWMTGQSHSSKSIQILETCYIGKDQKILIIKVANKEGLVGVTAHQMNWLTDLNEQPTFVTPKENHVSSQISVSEPNPSPVNPVKEDFQETLQNFLSKFKKPRFSDKKFEEA